MKGRIEAVQNRIRATAQKAGRRVGEVRLVAVSKTVSAERVKAAIDVGIDLLGENYIQEARDKINRLYAEPVSWHFIGHLQSNKAKYAVRLFDLIHSVDSLKLGTELSHQARKLDKVQKILVQVNISQEPSKSGVSSAEAPALIRALSRLDGISIHGLMTMPPFFDDPQRARPYFRDLHQLARTIESQRIANVRMDELSMGMTGDFEAAIEEGATLVRIGTAIFGERQ